MNRIQTPGPGLLPLELSITETSGEDPTGEVLLADGLGQPRLSLR